VVERGDISKLPATWPAPAAPAGDADSTLRPLRGPMKAAPLPAAAAPPLPPLGDPRTPGPVPAATPDSISLGEPGCCPAVRCLRCCAMVCCRRWFTTSSGLVGELSTVSFTLQAGDSTRQEAPATLASSIMHEAW
jgi:hypothetical protein